MKKKILSGFLLLGIVLVAMLNVNVVFDAKTAPIVKLESINKVFAQESSGSSSGEESSGSSSSSGGEELFELAVNKPNYPCPEVTVTWIIYYHNAETVQTNYSNGQVVLGAAAGKTITGQQSGGPATYPGFIVTWIECQAKAGLGCKPCPPITACMYGCTSA